MSPVASTIDLDISSDSELSDDALDALAELLVALSFDATEADARAAEREPQAAGF
jgi:hypothetical protein